MIQSNHLKSLDPDVDCPGRNGDKIPHLYKHVESTPHTVDRNLGA
jgi:hypothetical protein